MEQSNQAEIVATLNQEQIEHIAKSSYLTGYEEACDNVRGYLAELDKQLIEVVQKIEAMQSELNQ